MIYTINIVTITKSTDIYDAVAINKFPIIISCDNTQLDEYLKSPEMKSYCEKIIKSKNLYEHAKFYIRCIDDENYTTPEDKIEPVNKYIELNYGGN